MAQSAVNTKGTALVIAFRCMCGRKYHVRAEFAGKRGVCAACFRDFVVPVRRNGKRRANPTTSVQTGDEERSQT
jgi:hypothetical protein